VLVSGWWWSGLCTEIPCGVDMERRFSVEAKKFFFSVRVDKADFRLEERRKDFVGYVFVGVQCSVWLVDMIEEVLKSLGKEDFVKSYHEDEKVLMVRGVVIRPVVIWRWPFMQRVVRNVSFGFPRVVEGGDGDSLWESCVSYWCLLKPNLGCRVLLRFHQRGRKWD